jgi:hypothetical protein
MLPEQLEFLVQSDDQPFDARGQQARADRRINQRWRGGPTARRQLRDKAILAQTNGGAVGGPQHQLAPAVEDQDFGYAGTAEIRDER